MINQLKLEMNNLTRLVEAGAGLSIGEEATMNELLKQKEELTAERDSQVSPIGYSQLHEVSVDVPTELLSIAQVMPIFVIVND